MNTPVTTECEADGYSDPLEFFAVYGEVDGRLETRDMRLEECKEAQWAASEIQKHSSL